MTADAGMQPATLTTAPTGRWIPVAMIYHLIVALLGTSAIVISLWLSGTNPEGGGINGIVFTLSYFTVWSNIFVCAVNWGLALHPGEDGVLFRWLRMSTLVMIVITGLVYALVLAADARPQGLGVYTNAVFHYIVPWATLLGFLLFGPRPRFTLRHVFLMLIIPVAWLGYTLIHGEFLTRPPANPPITYVQGEPQHWYPYPFIDVNDPTPLVPGVQLEGYAGVAVNIVVILLLGIAFAFIMLGLDRWLSGGRRPTVLSQPRAAPAEGTGKGVPVEEEGPSPAPDATE